MRPLVLSMAFALLASTSHGNELSETRMPKLAIMPTDEQRACWRAHKAEVDHQMQKRFQTHRQRATVSGRPLVELLVDRRLKLHEDLKDEFKCGRWYR